MITEDLTQDLLDWIEAIEIDPLAWSDGMLEAILDMEGVCDSDKSIILRRHKALLN